MRSTLAQTAVVSVTSRFKNFLLAGTLAKSSSTMIVVPSEHPRSLNSTTSPQSITSSAPSGLSLVFEIIRSLDTAAIAAKASPRNPSVYIPSRSSAFLILLVACRLTAKGRSVESMPQPSSEIRISVIPPFCISTVMWRAPASIEFSIISFIAEAGLSTTSPAAIKLATSKDKMFIFPTDKTSFS